MNKPEAVALVSCVKSKARGPCPAKDLYRSTLFRYMRAYAERHADRWFILSAKHGLVDPSTTLRTYNESLIGTSVKLRREWARRIHDQMGGAGLLNSEVRILWLAGKLYSRELSRLLVDVDQVNPLEGLGIGDRMAWLKQATQSVNC